MKIEKCIEESIKLVNDRTKVYRQRRVENPIFFYFAKSLLDTYLSYVKKIDEKEIQAIIEKHGFWEGTISRLRFVNLIKHISKRCNTILEISYKGDIWQAGTQIIDLLANDKDIKKYLVEPLANNFDVPIEENTCFYRMRDERKGVNVLDCWHVPFPLRKYTCNYRYSLAGFPCLYLADSLKTSNKEMGKLQSGKNRWISCFKAKKTQSYFDLHIPQKEEILNLDEVDQFNFLVTYPVRLLCSIKKNKKDLFHEEYYFPQLVLYCLCVSENKYIHKYNGIKYSSTENEGGVNYVLPARYKGLRPPTYSHSQELLDAFEATIPIIYKE